MGETKRKPGRQTARMITRFIQFFLKRKKKPSPSDYRGNPRAIVSRELLRNKGFAEFFKTKKKRDELEVIRELEPDYEPRRIP